VHKYSAEGFGLLVVKFPEQVVSSDIFGDKLKDAEVFNI